MSLDGVPLASAAAPPPQRGWFQGWGTAVYNRLPSVPRPGMPYGQTAEKIQGVAERLDSVMQNPEEFAYQMTRGIIHGVTESVGGEAASAAEPSPTLMERVKRIVIDGVSAASIEVLQLLLAQSFETYDLDPEDQNLREEAQRILAEGRDGNAAQAAKQVWDMLNKYHLLGLGLNINRKHSSDEMLKQERIQREGSDNDGLSPIHALIECQQSWRVLKEHHGLNAHAPTSPLPSAIPREEPAQPLSAGHLQGLRDRESQTDRLIQEFSRKTVDYATMHFIHALFNHSFDTVCYKLMLEEPDVESAYLRRFDGPVRRPFYKLVFLVVRWLLRPIIAHTIEGVVKHLRDFLKNDANLLNLIEQKMGVMADYYARVEKARADYLCENRPDDIGLFSNFLKHTIQKYGENELTEDRLIQLFGNYIVDNFVPRPHIRIGGHRIPLISSFVEWVVYSVRKAMVRLVLKKTGIIQETLTHGTNAVRHAQLGLKRLLALKLSQVYQVITRSRSDAVNPLNLEEGESIAIAKRNHEALKTELISPELHERIGEYSTNLLRFIDIESCSGDVRKLTQLNNNRVSALFEEIITSVTGVLNNQPSSLSTVLEEAVTDSIETALVTLFVKEEEKQEQIEELFQTIFQLLNESYIHVPEDRERERAFNRESKAVDENIKSLQLQLSRSAIAAATEKHFKNVSGEQHNRMKTYVASEHEIYTRFSQSLALLSRALDIEINTAGTTPAAIKEKLVTIVALIEQHLTHISMQLNSPSIGECYADVRGDLHNLYAQVIVELNSLRGQMAIIAGATGTLKEVEEELVGTQACFTILGAFQGQLEPDRAIAQCDQLKATLPRSIVEACTPLLTTLAQQYAQSKIQAATLADFDRREALRREEQQAHQRLGSYETLERELRGLALSCKELHDQKNEARKRKLAETITAKLDLLRAEAVKDKAVEESILVLLRREPQDLYRVFYPSFLASSVPIFTRLSTMKQECQESIRTKRIAIARVPPAPESRAEIIGAMEDTNAQIGEGLRAINEAIHQNKVVKEEAHDTLFATIGAAYTTAFVERAEAFSKLENHFGVKGCISIGAIQFQKDLAPIFEGLARKIDQRTEQMIRVMMKPIHVRQFFLRLVILDCADRQVAAGRH